MKWSSLRWLLSAVAVAVLSTSYACGQTVRYSSAPLAPAPGQDPYYSTVSWESDAEAECITGCAAPGCGCVDPHYGPRWFAFGDLLIMRPTNEKVAYAVPINGAIVPPGGAAPVQVGLEAVVDCDYDAGFRVGGGMIFSDCSNLGVAYTHYDVDSASAIARTPPYVLRSLVDHPGSWAARI